MELIAGGEHCCEEAGWSAGEGRVWARGAFVLLNYWQICFFKPPSIDAKIQEISILVWSYIKDSWNGWTITAYFLWWLCAHRVACSQAFLGGHSHPRHCDRWTEAIPCRPAFSLFLGKRQQIQETSLWCFWHLLCRSLPHTGSDSVVWGFGVVLLMDLKDPEFKAISQRFW